VISHAATIAGMFKVAVARWRRPDAHALIGQLDMHRVLVGGGIDRNGRDAELLGRTQDSERNLAPVGDQDFIEHRGGLLDRSQPLRVGFLYSGHSNNHQRLVVFNRRAIVDQDAHDLAGPRRDNVVNVFIASTSSSLSPTFTMDPTSTNGLVSGLARK